MSTDPPPIRVLVVDDSRTVAEFLTRILESDRRIRVVGTAADGEAAIAAVQRLQPDVITMDIHMPKVDGFAATRRIMETHPLPIIIVTGSTRPDEVATTFRAVEVGAVTVIARPSGPGDPGHESSVRALLDAVRLMSEVKVVRRWARPGARSAGALHAPPAPRSRPNAAQVVAIGASTGGPLALQCLLAALPKDLPVPVLVAQHMSPGFAQGFAQWLTQASGFATRVARDGETLQPGHAYVPPDDFHLGLRRGHRALLAQSALENGMRPAVSFLFRSVRETLASGAIAVLLTGMGRDGVEELKRLKDAGAVTIAQDRESSVIHGMPGEAIRLGAATHVLAPEAIAAFLKTMVVKS